VSLARKHRSGACTLCGVWRYSLHRDHILAKCRGGIDEPNNIQLICANCHEDKTRADVTGVTAGRRKSDETRAKISAALKGRPLSAAHAAHLRELRKKQIGHPCSPETRAKIAAKALGRTGRVATAETRAKMSRAMTGWWSNASPEMRTRITAKLRHRVAHTPEAKAKMSLACREAWRRRKNQQAAVTGG
jgi:hypothetical protein